MNQFCEYTNLWRLVNYIEMDATQDDQITWKLTGNGQYTASSVYKAQFIGCTMMPHLNAIRTT